MSVPPIILSMLLLTIGPSQKQLKESDLNTKKGSASYYSQKFEGRKTAFGEKLDNETLTAAHPTLPHNTLLEITNPQNNKKVVVRVNDRGPFGRTKRVLDMSRAAAKELDIVRAGVAAIEYKVVGTNGKLFADLGITKIADIISGANNHSE